MNHEVNVRAAVQVGNLVAGVGEPQVGVADERHAKGVLVGKLLLNGGHLPGVDVPVALEVHVVGMYVESIATRREQGSKTNQDERTMES